MKKLSLLVCFLFITVLSIQAQCPPSTEPGYHIVQQDENLFRISIMYGISLNRLLAMNNMQETDILPTCKKIRIGESIVQPQGQKATFSAGNTTANNRGSYPPAAPTSTSTSSALGQKQAGNRHVVQAGETIAGLARLYGYTEERFREFNAMGNDRLTTGSIVLSHDCNCDRVMFSENATPTGGTTTSPTSIAYEPPPTTTTYYESTAPTRIQPHEPISPAIITNPNKTEPSVGNTSPAAAESYMSSSEMDMITEINMMRANPSAYTKYIDGYVADQKANNGWPVDMTIVAELKKELSKLGALSQLKPTECIYIAAKKHGQDMIRMGRTDHIGSDGKWPWDRVRRECSQMADGNENLVGGPDNIRESVVILLLDEGIPNRGHRKTLLRSDWEYVACYKVGTVGSMPNCWVQKFGFSGASSSGTSSSDTSTTSNTPGDAGDSGSYMTSLEKEMVDEINMMRANPSGYAKYIDEYVADQNVNGGWPIDMTVVSELKRALKIMGALRLLQPKECVYTAAKKHGQDQIKMGDTNHLGSDGKMPMDRILYECPDLRDGTENLAGGMDNVRETVITLLIDDGIPSRGHRKALLNANWKYLACYKVGMVGTMPHCWVQKFGY
jgi:uncharacterized protein YkwD/LysM repeat protein